MTLIFALFQVMDKKTRSWKLNKNLGALGVVAGVQKKKKKENVSHYFAENANGKVNDGIL